MRQVDVVQDDMYSYRYLMCISYLAISQSLLSTVVYNMQQRTYVAIAILQLPGMVNVHCPCRFIVACMDLLELPIRGA